MEPAIDRIMSRVNDSFSFIERLHNTGAMLAANGIPRLKELVTNQTFGLKIIQVSLHNIIQFKHVCLITFFYLQDLWPQALTTLQRLLGEQGKPQLAALEQLAKK
jgi:hypothetical protein